MTREELVRSGRGEGDAHFRGDVRDRRTIGALLISMADRIEADGKLIAELREALEEIARQKRTDELVTSVDVEYADFEQGYDDCIDCARAILAKLEEQE